MTHPKNTPHPDWQERWRDLPASLELPPDQVPQGSIIQIQGNKDTKGYYFLAEFGRFGLKGIALEKGWKPGEPIRYQTSPYYWTRPVRPEFHDRVCVVSVPTDEQIRSSEEHRMGRLNINSGTNRQALEERIRGRSDQVRSVLQQTMSPPGSDYTI